MLKIPLVLFCCTVSSYCICQQQPDSAALIPAVNPKATTENFPNIIKPSLSIYPNPAKNKVTIQVTDFTAGMATVQVIDTKGKLVRQDKRLLTNGSEEIIMFLMLDKGIYFITVSEPGKIARKKLVIL